MDIVHCMDNGTMYVDNWRGFEFTVNLSFYLDETIPC